MSDFTSKTSAALGAALVLDKLPKDDPKGAQYFAHFPDFCYGDMNGSTRRFAAAYDRIEPVAESLLVALISEHKQALSSWLAKRSQETGSQLLTIQDAVAENPLGVVGVVSGLLSHFTPLDVPNDHFVAWLPKRDVENAFAVLSEAGAALQARSHTWVGSSHLGRYAEHGYFLDDSYRLLDGPDRVLLNRDWLVGCRELMRAMAPWCANYSELDAVRARLKQAYDATTPPLPATSESLLELLKDERVFSHPMGGRFMAGFYGVKRLGDLVLADLSGADRFLNRPLDDMRDARMEQEVQSQGVYLNSESFITRPLSDDALQSLRELLADRGIVPDAIPESVKEQYRAWRATDAGEKINDVQVIRPLLPFRSPEEW